MCLDGGGGGGHRSLGGTPPQLGERGHTARGYCRAAAPLSFARLPSSLMLLFKTTMPFLRWRRRLNYKDDYGPNRSSSLEDPDVDHAVLNAPKEKAHFRKIRPQPLKTSVIFDVLGFQTPACCQPESCDLCHVTCDRRASGWNHEHIGDTA